MFPPPTDTAPHASLWAQQRSSTSLVITEQLTGSRKQMIEWGAFVLSWPHVIIAVQVWGTPSAWRHVPRPPMQWVFIWALPVHFLPTIVSHNINQVIQE